MNSSTVTNILYSYFDIKKGKLIWTGSLETLKAFVLTEVDEATAERTTWRSPSGGQNIHFDGERGSDLTERIHSFLEQKAENASPAELDLERSIESLLADDCDDVNDDSSEESLSYNNNNNNNNLYFYPFFNNLHQIQKVLIIFPDTCFQK